MTETPASPNTHQHSWLDRPLTRWFPANLETLLVLLILILALASRFTGLDARVMSHDEINHVVPSYDYAQGRGYRYDPMSHGPLQFHLIALSYFLWGDSDFTSRIPAAAFSVATIACVLVLYRRYLGRSGALAAGLMFLISPYMLFYGRYARNEAFTVLWAVLGLYAILRYLEHGRPADLMLFTLVQALHFCDKATAYIFAAEELLLLGAYLLYRLMQREWALPPLRRRFLGLLTLAALLVITALLSGYSSLFPPAAPAVPAPGWQHILALACLAGGLIFGAAAAAALVRGMGWQALHEERSLDLLVLLTCLVLPLLAALPLKMAGFDPSDLSLPGRLRLAVLALGLLAVSAVLAWWWLRSTGWKAVLLFYLVFTLFYTSFLTNPGGLAAGWSGAFSYWADQQTVNRGGQPWFYYALLQIPLYEFLPACGALLAAVTGWRRRLWSAVSGRPFQSPDSTTPAPGPAQPAAPVPTLALLVSWSLCSLIAFSLAGEKMPWLTVNIAAPSILAAGWVVGYLLESGTQPAHFSLRRLTALSLLACLAVLTARAAYRAAFILYDTPEEFLVYAHSAPDPKIILAQIEDISLRTTGGRDLKVAYDNESQYPFWWYLRAYPNKISYADRPTRELRQAAVILVGEGNYARIAPVVADDYLEYNYTRLWWPNEDYKHLGWESISASRGVENAALPMSLPEYLLRFSQKIGSALGDAGLRGALWQIWLNRNYSAYAALQDRTDFKLESWQPANRMRMYVRRDVATQLWGSPEDVEATRPLDPYAQVAGPVQADQVAGEGQLNAPHALAFAADGSLYLADSGNHRVLHLSSSGAVLQAWGTFADSSKGAAPGGTFFEPWGVAVAPDGSVYVSDTWNHRIQKFSADGQFQLMWGYTGAGETPEALWGPRGIAVDSTGRVYVVDSGNKRVVVFDASGNFIAQFGGAGMLPGQFDEPVGIALDSQGRMYISDTWNQRIQVLQPDLDSSTALPIAQWNVDAWYGQSLQNKPFIAVDDRQQVYVTDPEGAQVLEFSSTGQIINAWRFENDVVHLPSGVAIDPGGRLWVSDVGQQVLINIEK